ncbi:MAG: hypothetical protein K2Y71_25380 [Xanthobacteraceae bacterium]|nr:hypothetical protein [Xanthobacteraceae bacterium]
MKSALIVACMLALVLAGSSSTQAQKAGGGPAPTTGTYKPAPPRTVSVQGGQYQAPTGTQKSFNCYRKRCHWH